MILMAEEYTEGKKISKAKAELWFNLLKVYSIETIERVIKKIIRTRTINNFPKISEIIQEIEGTQSDIIMEKWLLVKEIITKVGAYQSVQFEDQIINSVIYELGGWPKVCEVSLNDLKWMQRDFERLYPVMARKKDHPKILLGVADQTNKTDSKPIFIENKKNQIKLNYEKA